MKHRGGALLIAQSLCKQGSEKALQSPFYKQGRHSSEKLGHFFPSQTIRQSIKTDWPSLALYFPKFAWKDVYWGLNYRTKDGVSNFGVLRT